MKIALDSNILAYIAGVQRVIPDLAKIHASRSLVDRLTTRAVLIAPSQTLGELFNVMLKGGFDRQSARGTVHEFTANYHVVHGRQTTFTAAFDLAVDHKLQFWDSLILSTAAEAGCALFLSEDLQDGFTTRGMTIANPFLSSLQPALSDLLSR